MDVSKIDIGDEIIFSAVTRWGNSKLRRVVVAVCISQWPQGSIGVNAHGCRPFYVRYTEILKVIPHA